MSALVLDKGVCGLHTLEVPYVWRDVGRASCGGPHDDGDDQGCGAGDTALTAGGEGERETRVEGENILDEDALVALEGGVDKGHGGRETMRDEIALAVGPAEFEIVHGGTTGGGVGREVGGGGRPGM